MISKSFMALVISCLVCGVVLPQTHQRESKKEVRSRLFKQVLAEYPDIRECVEKEEGGTRTAEENMSVEEVDLNRGLTVEQLDKLIGKRDYRLFLNSRNELYRERGMKENPPAREEALRLMSENPNLIKRPILVKGGQMALGFDEPGFLKLL